MVRLCCLLFYFVADFTDGRADVFSKSLTGIEQREKIGHRANVRPSPTVGSLQGSVHS